MSRLLSKLAGRLAFLTAAAGAVMTTALSGCSTDAFCWDDCPGDVGSATSSGMGGAGGDDIFPAGSGGAGGSGTSAGGAGGAGGEPCMFTGNEICDGKDNDCDGKVDNSPDFSLDTPQKCGTCDNNCFSVALFCEEVVCVPSPNPGVVPGTCQCNKCIEDYYDIDGDKIACEYPCFKTDDNDAKCDNKDNDCDGVPDEDVNICSDTANCGKCGNNCVVVNGTGACVNDGQMPCTEANTQCKIQQCNCNGPNDCWKDLDGLYTTGCEYKCAETNNGVEICGDGLDNDCDGKIDGADDLGGDPQVGAVCYADPDGECATPAHAGVTVCQGNKVVCTGPNLLDENDDLETCNGKDDDCDGAVDDSPVNAGTSCGQSNVAPCAFGVNQCQNGMLVCVGAVNPQTETCNGQDDDCDTVIDDNTSDSGGTCGQSNTAPCKFGTIQCNGGVLLCVGAADPQPEACDGIDNNCNGMVDDGASGTGMSCGQSNVAPCQLGTTQCQNGAIACVGAVGPQTETCDTIDNDCNGVIDDSATGTGVSCGQSNVAPCQLGTIQCQGGALTCVGAVNPAASESCNGVDDDCDGAIDDSPMGIGGTCGQTSVGPCELGTIQCQAGQLTCVGAVNPQQETCNGADDDCNGVVDNNTTGAGVSCGQSNTFPCQFGTTQCQAGSLVCVGAVNPQSETCDNKDNDCDGVIDDTPSGTGASCGATNVGECEFGSIQCQGGALVCVGAKGPQSETCNGKDDDCDGATDDSPSGTGGTCGQTSVGPCELGTFQCQGGALVCVGEIAPKTETCNSIDDNCDGVVDNNAAGTGASCGQSNTFPCSFGSTQCQAGAIVCVGAVNPQAETCNGVDDNCDGQIDKTGANPPPDSVGACNVPPPPPPGATSPCMAGAKACVGGSVVCQGSTGPSAASDACGVDSNCDGALTNQPNLQTDPNNCGSCGNNCYANAMHSIWSCNAGTCSFQGCENGFYDLNGDFQCEYACTFVSAQEACNGTDDDCDGQVDEGVIAPTPTQVCGVNPSASTPECKSTAQGGLITVACVSGAWQCTFPSGVCSPSCAGAMETCDLVDNNCNGQVNENTPNFGKPCASDDGLPAPGHGACRTTGTFACTGPSTAACNAVKANCSGLPGGCTELCDGVDNDCDGSVDETYQSKGTDPAFFLKPAVTKIGATSWIYSYEASRPTATNLSPGSGNGFHVSAPVGQTLDKTLACSTSSKIPWFNVTPIEVEQTCAAMGGKVCELKTNWTPACQATASCTWGYNPRGAACTSTYNASKYCNLGPSFDFDPASAGDQDGLLPTASGSLANCWSDWSGLQSNTVATNKLYDMTGNLREVSRCQRDRAICGPDAAACALSCCSGASTLVGSTLVCGALGANNRRLSGQTCTANAQCCNLDGDCTANGTCKADAGGQNFCTNNPAPALSCRARGVACTNSNQCCGGDACSGGFCGGPGTLPHSLYPLMGGSFSSSDPNGASCTFDFFTVAADFKLFDAGFRCCFSSNPTL